MPIRIPGTWRTEEVDGKRTPLQWHYVLDEDDDYLDLREELDNLRARLGFRERDRPRENFGRIFLNQYMCEPEPRDHPDILDLLEES